jgi:long-subunit acyl-CoA synthetase (AMP-forming)
MIRGPIFTGYRDDPARTREAFDDDGWLHTGDIATVDEDGYYRIVDRKKDIMINSAGRNMAPAMIEAAIKRETPLAAFAVAIGDRRRYVTALISLDPDRLTEFASKAGLAGSISELAASAQVRAEIERCISAANSHLARVEQVKRFLVLTELWEPGSDLITSSMKLRRRAISAHYEEAIERLYAEAAVGV